MHFASLMDVCHLKNSELEPQFQKYKGRVVLRGDIVKDDSGSHAAFTEQGSSTSQKTAAKVMDIISSSPGCSGQAVDAVSACTQVKMEDASTLFKIPKSEWPDFWIRVPKHKWPKSWSSIEDPDVPLERNLYGHPLAGLFREGHWEKFSIGNVYLSTEQDDYSCPCMWTISNWQARQKTWNRLGKFSWKTLTWEDQHHFLTMYFRVALIGSVKSARILWRTTEICSNPGFLLEPTKNYRPELQGNLIQGNLIWKVTQRHVWTFIANLQIKRLDNYTKFRSSQMVACLLVVNCVELVSSRF